MPKKISVSKLSSGFIEIVGFLAMLALLVMMSLTTVDVFSRWFFARPILGAMEMTEVLMVSIMALSLAWCTFRSGHIRVDIITSLFSKKTNRVIDIVNYCLTAAVIAFVVPGLIRRYVEGIEFGAATPVLKIPEGPFVLLLTFGYFLTFLVLIVHIVKTVLSGGRDEP
jgi:TRAP-type C4-dicarboxylate transport system permease small subunit